MGNSSRVLAATALVALAAACLHGEAAAAPPQSGEPWRIVILHGADGQLPVSVQADAAFREAVGATAGKNRLEIYPEDLDTIRFPAAQLDAEQVALLAKKHSARRPHVVVAFSGNALAFAERHHQELWPEATLIFMGVNKHELPASLGSHAATGVVLSLQHGKTVELALRLLPETRRVVLVGGASQWDRDTMAFAKSEMARFAGRVEIEYLENVAFEDVLEAVARLREGTLLFPISMFRDSRGQPFTPSDAFLRMTQAAPVPNLAVLSSRFGRDVLGGHMVHYTDQGREAGLLVNEIIAGRDARSLPVRVPPPDCLVDWRQLQRFGIPTSRVPEGCEVRFREYTFWEQHWGKALTGILIILLQAVLITVLVLQHRRRRRAELDAQVQRSQLAHAARLATVGELTASIAHEINQPLGAILSNADAAEILLEAPEPDLAEVRQILADIRRDNERASAVIQRLRALLERHELDRHRLDPNAVVREAMTLISHEANRRGMRLVEDLSSSMPAVQGDRVHLVQVLIVLLLNAIDAMDAIPPAGRRIVVSTGVADTMVEIAVRDAGPGIPAEDFSRLFDSFFTTKAKGMGLGLSIARTIVEAHGGRIWAENLAGGGALFRFRLAVAP